MDAVIDECFNEQTGSYSVAAVLIPAAQLANVLAAIAQTPGFKWRNSRAGGRLAFIQTTLVSNRLDCLVAVGQTARPSEQETCRWRCLRKLFPVLARRGATMVTLDWRPGHLNGIDERNIQWMIAHAWIPPAPVLRHRFRNPTEVPLLRLADALAGASSAQSAGDSQYVSPIATQVSWWAV